MFYGREKELQALEERYNSGRFEFIPIYGRLRVGKTTLIKEFLKKHEGVFFTAKNDTLKANVDGHVETILGLFETDMGHVFEEVCAEHMRCVYGGEIGTWWGTDRNTRTIEEIDIIASKMVDGNKTGWFAECKYRSGPVDMEVLGKLRHRITLVKGYSVSHPVIYSKSGFTETVLNDADVDLYTLDDVLNYYVDRRER